MNQVISVTEEQKNKYEADLKKLVADYDAAVKKVKDKDAPAAFKNLKDKFDAEVNSLDTEFKLLKEQASEDYARAIEQEKAARVTLEAELKKVVSGVKEHNLAVDVAWDKYKFATRNIVNKTPDVAGFNARYAKLVKDYEDSKVKETTRLNKQLADLKEKQDKAQEDLYQKLK